MKKLFTLCAAMMLSLMAMAQADGTFQFVDASGNVVADGSTIVVNQLNDEGQMVVPLSVKNVSGDQAAVSMYETINAKPGGTWQTCAFGNCMMLSEDGYSPKNIVDADYYSDIQTEWIPEQGQYATWEATLQIHVFDIKQQTKFGQTIYVPTDDIIGYGPKVTVRFEYTDPDASQSAGVWWGYTSQGDETYGLGTQKAETYDCAIYVPAKHAIAAGKTISAVRFELNSANVKDVKVWIAETSRPTNVSNAAIVESIDSPAQGVNEVKLSTPYTIGSKNIYVGYSFTITALSTDDDKYPISICEKYDSNGLWLRTTSTTSWSSLAEDYGDLYMQLYLEGDFPENAANFGSSDIGDYTAAVGGTTKVYVPVINTGSAPLTAVKYTITTDSQPTASGTLNFSSQPLAFGESRTMTVEVSADNAPGTSQKVITIDQVNGKDNEDTAAQATFSLVTVSKIVERGIAVEEFTGTQCGWCPRGIAGMEKLRAKYGDKFVGAAIHGYANGTSDDAMYLTSYSTKYAKIFSGSAPSCQLNRAYGEIDPYYGTSGDICTDFENELSIPARVAISLKGEWNADSTKVTATADLEAVVGGQTYTIEYALIADGLTGTASAWNQQNYYASYSASSYSAYPDIAQFCNGGEHGQSVLKGWTFNDVVIATCYVSSKNKTTAPGTLEVGQTVSNSYTLSLPTDTPHANLRKAIDKSKVAVVAFVIAADGTVANAAKYYMPVKGDVNGDGTVDVADISAVISVMAGISDYKNADVNGDGNVDVADISTIISQMAAGK